MSVFWVSLIHSLIDNWSSCSGHDTLFTAIYELPLHNVKFSSKNWFLVKTDLIFTINRSIMWLDFLKLWVLGHPAAWTPTSNQQYSDLVTCSDENRCHFTCSLHSNNTENLPRLSVFSSEASSYCLQIALAMGLMAVIYWAFCNITEKLHDFDV